MQNAIAFFTDRTMLPGLHAAIVSMLSSNLKLNADIFVFSDGLTEDDKKLLEKTWSVAGAGQPLNIRQYSPQALGKKLHGNSTAYGRLYLGDLLPEYDRCIYLDCDLIINTSLVALFDYLPSDALMAADCAGNRKWSLDSQLFVDSGIGLEGSYFNSGVLVLNLEIWRSSNAIERCHEIASRFAPQFAAADQSLLNVAFHDKVVPFGEKYNTPLYPLTKMPSSLNDSIYHFVGSPKPWDLFGSQLHNSYAVWKTYFVQSAIGEKSLIPYRSLRRITQTSRPMFRAWRSQMTKR